MHSRYIALRITLKSHFNAVTAETLKKIHKKAIKNLKLIGALKIHQKIWVLTHFGTTDPLMKVMQSNNQKKKN